MYIAIEGLKCSGKTVLVNRLEHFLKENNVDFSLIKTTKIGNENSFMEKMYKKYSFLNKSSLSRAIVYARRAYIAVKNTNWNSQLVLGDRSVITSYATRWRKWFNSPKLSILFVNITEYFVPAPDIVIFMQVSMENLQQRIKARNTIDIDSSSERLHEMNEAYKEISAGNIIKKIRHVQWIYTDANKKEEDVYNDIGAIILQCLNKK